VGWLRSEIDSHDKRIVIARSLDSSSSDEAICLWEIRRRSLRWNEYLFDAIALAGLEMRAPATPSSAAQMQEASEISEVEYVA